MFLFRCVPITTQRYLEHHFDGLTKSNCCLTLSCRIITLKTTVCCINRKIVQQNHLTFKCLFFIHIYFRCFFCWKFLYSGKSFQRWLWPRFQRKNQITFEFDCFTLCSGQVRWPLLWSKAVKSAPVSSHQLLQYSISIWPNCFD